MEKQGLKGIFSICDKILDENFRPIKNIEKFFKKKAINKKNQYQRILLNSSEISEEETSERNTEPVPEHETDLERRIRESRKRKKSLLRGPKCKRGKSLEKDPVSTPVRKFQFIIIDMKLLLFVGAVVFNLPLHCFHR